MERESQWAVSLECSKFGEEVPQLVVPAGRAQASPEVKLDFAPVHLPADLHVEIASVQTARNGLDLDPGLLTLHRFPKTKLAYSTGLSGASSSGKWAPSMAESQRAWQSSSRRRARRDLETRVSDRRAGRSRYEAVCGRWFKGTQSVPSKALSGEIVHSLHCDRMFGRSVMVPMFGDVARHSTHEEQQLERQLLQAVRTRRLSSSSRSRGARRLCCLACGHCWSSRVERERTKLEVARNQRTDENENCRKMVSRAGHMNLRGLCTRSCRSFPS